uniref:F-box protein AT5G49610-like beta-propeller domain-containing protein n=2 Tax=Aegilops tauschii subsp. strangulata TaxID=200361 RepID=A0A453MYI9_AEGTS
TTYSPRSSSVSPRSRPPYPAPPPSASDGAASPPIQPSPAASASTTAATLHSSAASAEVFPSSASNLPWAPPTPGRLSLQFKSHVRVLGCRHGLVLILDQTPQLLVWDPVTCQQHLLAYSPEFDPDNSLINGAVLRSAAGAGDVHFQVVLVASEYEKKLLACVYSSETGVWGTLFSTPMPSGNSLHTRVCLEHAVLVGDSLYWILAGTTLFNLLEFDLKTESLAVIPLPADKSYDAGLNSPEGRFTVMRAEGGGLGLLSVSGFTAQLWKRKTDFDDVASWGMGRTVELDELLSMDSKDYLDIEGYAEDNNLVFLWTGRSLFTVKFEPLQCKKLFDTNNRRCYYPFETVYAAGT